MKTCFQVKTKKLSIKVTINIKFIKSSGNLEIIQLLTFLRIYKLYARYNLQNVV